MMRIFCIALLALLTSCNQHSSATSSTETTPPAATAAPVKDNFNTGVVIPMVPIRMDAGETFALYLPKGYNDSVRLPMIIFFDPHGGGDYPLNLYHELADKYHYILVGSNNSKNGVPYDQTKAIAQNLFKDVRNRFSVDTNHITYCGFSGGAKVAMLSANENPEISTIIYAGAKVDLQPRHPISFVGFAGVKDMNYTDLVVFDKSLEGSPFKHYLIQWNGKHEFPTADVFNDAFVFLTTGTVKDYDKKRVTITNTQFEYEQHKKQEYINNFKNKDLGWWKTEIEKLNADKKTNMTDERLLGFLSLAGYSIGGSQLEQNKLDFAEKILSIYKMADPGNTDCDSMINELNRRKGMMMGPK